MDEHLQTIQEFLNSALDQAVEVEVVYSALQAMKSNPQLTISQAMAHGYYEWVK